MSGSGSGRVGSGGGEGGGNRAHYTILGLGNVDCTGGLRVGTGIFWTSYCRYHVTIVLKSLQSALPRQKWNGPIPCSQHSYSGTCPFEEGGGGVLAVKVFAC